MVSDEEKRNLIQVDLNTESGVLVGTSQDYGSNLDPPTMMDPIVEVTDPTQSSAPRHNSRHSATSFEDPFHCHEEGSGSGGDKANGTNKRAVRILWLSVAVCLFFMLCEVVGGIWAQSLAIITDAAHLLTDLASMLISLFSLYLASRPASQRMSFGWHRAEVLGAFISVFMIWVVTGILVYLAVDRMITKNYEINGGIMAITAGVGVLVNLLMGALLYFGGHTHSHGGASSHSHTRVRAFSSSTSLSNGNGTIPHRAQHTNRSDPEALHLLADEEEDDHHHSNHETNINVRAAFVHVLGDLVQSVGVLIAAFLILRDESWAVVDPICTLLFSVIVMSTTVYIIRDALVVLLEGRPSNIDFRLVFDALEHIEGVRKVHDLRIWALTMNKVAISVHLEVDPLVPAQTVLKKTTLMLRRNFNVHESTVQIEGWQPESQSCVQCIVPPR